MDFNRNPLRALRATSTRNLFQKPGSGLPTIILTPPPPSHDDSSFSPVKLARMLSAAARASTSSSKTHLKPPRSTRSRTERLANARKGIAIGSHRHNAVESPYLLDLEGRNMIERLDLGLEKLVKFKDSDSTSQAEVLPTPPISPTTSIPPTPEPSNTSVLLEPITTTNTTTLAPPLPCPETPITIRILKTTTPKEQPSPTHTLHVTPEPLGKRILHGFGRGETLRKKDDTRRHSIHDLPSLSRLRRLLSH